MLPALESRFPRPDPPDLLPPPVCLFTVAHARRSASPRPTPRFSYPSSMCSSIRFCLSVYFDLSPRGMQRLRKWMPSATCNECSDGGFILGFTQRTHESETRIEVTASRGETSVEGVSLS